MHKKPLKKILILENVQTKAIDITNYTANTRQFHNGCCKDDYAFTVSLSMILTSIEVYLSWRYLHMLTYKELV